MTRLKDDNEVVAPGDPLAEDDELEAGTGAYREYDKIKSKYFGSVTFSSGSVSVRPNSGRYVPEAGDTVIGEVSRISYSRWTVELNSPYDGQLDISEATDEYVDLDEDDLTDYFEVGDAIVVKVKSVTESMEVDLTMDDRRCKKLEGGRVVEIAPSKVPRVIGKNGRMVKKINSLTNCNIIVGQNGRVWIDGEHASAAAKAVKKVEEEAHRDNLTETIEEFLNEEVNN